MSVAWPLNLPDTVDAESFALKKGSTTIRSENDIGLAKVRRRFTKGIDVMTFQFTMTAAQYAIFDEYYEIDLNGGANTFSFNHPITGVESEFRIISEPDCKPKGGEYFTVTMQVEKMP